MKITGIRATMVALPAEEPLGDVPLKPGATRPAVALEVETDQGLVGIGFTFFGGVLNATLRSAVQQLGELLIGDDPLAIGDAQTKLRTAAMQCGPGGIFTLALSAIDIALWDIKGKALNLPLWKLLGGARERVPTYASGALMREFTDDQVVKSAAVLKQKGFTQAKMQLALPGVTSPAREVERTRLIREAIGSDFTLMCDINQRWRVEQAIDIGRRIEEYRLAWLEDVTTADDFPGLARVTAALSTPVTGGEYLYGLAPFRHMLEARSVDIVMIDPFRAGGVTGWLKTAATAEAFNLPVVSHLAPELQVHLIGAIPNGLTVEYMPWLTRMFEEVPWPKNGELAMPSGPGLGLRFDRDALKRFAAA